MLTFAVEVSPCWAEHVARGFRAVPGIVSADVEPAGRVVVRTSHLSQHEIEAAAHTVGDSRPCWIYVGLLRRQLAGTWGVS